MEMRTITVKDWIENSFHELMKQIWELFFELPVDRDQEKEEKL